MNTWYRSLPPATATVPCGGKTHSVRWAEGKLELTDHPDAEAELVLAALGGDTPGCVELAEIWNRHATNLALLELLPRSGDDGIAVGWEDVELVRGTGRPGGARGSAVASAFWLGRATLSPGAPPGLRQMHAQAQANRQRRLELLTLLALGPDFQLRLAGGIAAAHAGERGPALTAALAGRLAPATARWLDINPDDVTVTVYQGPGWGTLRAFGDSVWAAIPVGWLATVWACGLAVADGHLVVGVIEPGWPASRVIALQRPDSEPVELALHRG